MTLLNHAEWEQFTAAHPGAHLLQTGAWGALKSGFGWSALRLQAGDCGAQVLFRRLPLGLTVAYLPKGPLGSTEGWPALWLELDEVCRQQHAVFLLVEPDACEPPDPLLAQRMADFGAPADPIQPRRTLLIDLRGSESDWLARMSKKTRHCFNYAHQNGIQAVYSEDIEAFIQLMQQTGQRAQFGVHSADYYRSAFQLFSASGRCALLLAQREGNNLAGLLIFRQGERAYYLYGASSGEDRQFNPTYLIQLESMRWAASHGCTQYDLWGVPDAPLETLESSFSERSDGLWGVYGYKRKFGGELIRTAGAWRRVYNPVLFRLYCWWSARRGGEAG